MLSARVDSEKSTSSRKFERFTQTRVSPVFRRAPEYCWDFFDSVSGSVRISDLKRYQRNGSRKRTLSKNTCVRLDSFPKLFRKLLTRAKIPESHRPDRLSLHGKRLERRCGIQYTVGPVVRYSMVRVRPTQKALPRQGVRVRK